MFKYFNVCILGLSDVEGIEMYLNWLFEIRAKSNSFDSVHYKPKKFDTQKYNPMKDDKKLNIKMHTLTDGRFDEFPEHAETTYVGSAVYDIYNKKIVGFIKRDTLYSETLLEPDVVSRWLSLDPIVHPYESPYTAFANNPVYFVDPDGKDIYAGNAAAKKLITESILKVFGEKSGFSFKGNNNYLSFNKKEFKMAMKNFSEEQKLLAQDFKKVVKSSYEARVFVGEKETDTYSDKIKFRSIITSKERGNITEKTYEPFIIENQAIDAGRTIVFPNNAGNTGRHPDVFKIGYIEVNLEKLANQKPEELAKEGVKALRPTETFFHEVNDHFLPYIKSGNYAPKHPDKRDEIKSYNRAAKILGNEERTGATH